MALQKFVLLPDTGTHRQGLGKDLVEYKSGDVIETTDDLVKMFPNKFKLADVAGPADNDVTGDFDAAGENNLTVLKRGGKWYVATAAGAGTELSGALNKGKVEDFIYDYLETQGSEDDDEDDEDE